MGDAVVFTIEGKATYDAMITRLQAAPVELSNVEFEQFVHRVFDRSQEYVPIDTGALQGSGRIEKET